MRAAGPILAMLLLVLTHGAPARQEQKQEQQKQPAQEQAENSQQQRSANDEKPDPPNVVQIPSGDIRLGAGAVLHVEQLHATSMSRPGKTGCKEQTIAIQSGRLSLTDAGLAQLINHSFEKKGEKKRIKVTAEGDKLTFEGSKAAGMSMSFKAKPAALGDTRIALIATDVKMEHLPVKGLLHLFDLNMDDLMHPKNPALKVEKDNIIVDLRYVGKTTHLEGNVRSVAIQGNRIVLTFGADRGARKVAQARPPKSAAKKR